MNNFSGKELKRIATNTTGLVATLAKEVLELREENERLRKRLEEKGKDETDSPTTNRN